MFTRTYGALYQSHTQIFVKLFDELQEFYSESKYTPLKPILDRFFFDLFRTLLHILNPTDEIREDKSDCLKNSLALEAFGDIPLKMARQVERSLGAAKCLVHALKSSSDILQDVLQKELPTNCHVTATKMKYCAQCLPNPGSSTIGKTLKPCQMYCFNTINECFADYIVIENTWQQFIEALTKLAARLRGPYNVMAVLIPLAVQISESIMVFQEKAPAISARIARKCLRKDNGQSLKRETIPFKTSSESLPDFSSALSDAQSELLSSFVEKVRGTSGFWKVGPRLACINLTWIATTSDDLCWDGTKIVDNLKVTDEVSDNGIGSNFTTSVFLMERLKLLMLSNQLLESYEGRAYNDSIDVDVESSGNGDSYASVDDEDGDEFRDEGSGFDENQGAIVVDVAGSHRDITELATEESDIRNRSTIAPEPSVTLPMPHLEIAKISAAQKSETILEAS
uniref:Uncharacterized protein n=1 Tax=Setaria digitata TaxID=48799 RepID=A0A915PNP0_9BILA